MAPKCKRFVLSFNDKLEIINPLKKGEQASVLAREFNIGKSTITDIKHSEELLVKFSEKIESE